MENIKDKMKELLISIKDDNTNLGPTKKKQLMTEITKAMKAWNDKPIVSVDDLNNMSDIKGWWCETGQKEKWAKLKNFGNYPDFKSTADKFGSIDNCEEDLSYMNDFDDFDGGRKRKRRRKSTKKRRRRRRTKKKRRRRKSRRRKSRK
jgi:hypothetical protein